MSKKFEYSKVIILVIGITLEVVILFAMVMVVLTMDTTILDRVLIGLFSMADIGIGFYYSKAAIENKVKLRSIYGEKLTKGIVDSTSDNDDDDVVAG